MRLQRAWGCPPYIPGTGTGPLVTVTIADASCTEPSCYTHRTNESYVLAVSSTAVSIKARTIFGAGWALSSMTPLAQAICRVDCVPVKVDDAPRFGHRGILLDTGRNWFSPDDIKRRLLDPMAATKMNVLHWHVYDSQSQPLEVRSRPSLWQPYSPAQRYTQEQALDLVSYAFDRGIRILPEFDLPGHTAIFGKADASLTDCLNYIPWSGAGWPNVMANQPPAGQLKADRVGVATGLLREMMDLFPNKVISTGATEVNFNCWNEATITPVDDEGYPRFRQKSLAKLRAFQTKVASAVNQAGNTMAVYDESFTELGFNNSTALPKGSILFARSQPQRAPVMTSNGYNVVMMPVRPYDLDCGLGTASAAANACGPLNSWASIYGWDPLANFTTGSVGMRSRVLGGEVAAWSEHLRPSVLDYVVWPRAAALAEKLWSPASATRNITAAAARLRRLSERLTALGLNPSSLSWQSRNFRYNLLPQASQGGRNVTLPYCDTASPQYSHLGVDYCAPAAKYKGVRLTFGNLVID
ncbi:hypothetical protein CHLNCDRAFT_140700 [Chlorella variabilis]|uniref:Beta-hexosaminidase n=1 Tax=Chlorella variabilis TaxID=554065 RepID=E1Z603_CHLVA|nr:hypothetical protein CHLNCDRAFT_140700 [Chlorella variabilis]EFN58846.1 hypothetical protein CHLNCDRAFT_140700 [Chlorella variabilis]|eukprot:XP_005850948.1 hypothetical protein CHLNCDRAFT_140700 [Chlorella variabilis]